MACDGSRGRPALGSRGTFPHGGRHRAKCERQSRCNPCGPAANVCLPGRPWTLDPGPWKRCASSFLKSIILAAIGLIDSLVTLTVIDEMTNTRGQRNRKCVGQRQAGLASSKLAVVRRRDVLSPARFVPRNVCAVEIKPDRSRTIGPLVIGVAAAG